MSQWPAIGDFVTWSPTGVGRVDLIVTAGQVPGVDGDVYGTGDAPAARVLVWEPVDGRLQPAGWRVAVPAAQVAPMPPPLHADGKAALVALVAAHQRRGLPPHAVPSGVAVKHAYQRGLASWPGTEATTLGRERWALERAAAFLQLAAGEPPAKYRRDLDLLPATHPRVRGACG